MKRVQHGQPFVISDGRGAETAGRRNSGLPGESLGQRITEERLLRFHRVEETVSVFEKCAHTSMTVVPRYGRAAHLRLFRQDGGRFVLVE